MDGSARCNNSLKYLTLTLPQRPHDLVNVTSSSDLGIVNYMYVILSKFVSPFWSYYSSEFLHVTLV